MYNILKKIKCLVKINDELTAKRRIKWKMTLATSEKMKSKRYELDKKNPLNLNGNVPIFTP